MKTSLFAIGAATCMGFAGLVATASASPSGPSGSMTRSQYGAMMQKAFSEADSNNDGTVTAQERQAYRQKRCADAVDQHFTAVDTNRNGVIDRAEFTAAHDRRGSDERRPPMAHGCGPIPASAWQRHGMNPDGSVNVKQAMDRAYARFDRIDANHDGVITPAERQANRAQRGPRRDMRKGQRRSAR